MEVVLLCQKDPDLFELEELMVSTTQCHISLVNFGSYPSSLSLNAFATPKQCVIDSFILVFNSLPLLVQGDANKKGGKGFHGYVY